MKVLFTGGGTAGHVTPNIALMEAARQKGWELLYLGSPDGIEGGIIGPLGVPFHAVQSGKLRRYFSWKNLLDPLRVLVGLLQSLVICLREKPDRVFSKGGFVSVPVVVAAWLCRIPVVGHESDVTPGLANRFAYPFCRCVCVTFAETRRYLPAGKTRLTGTPLRRSLRSGVAARGLGFLGFDGTKPLLLVFGGSLGARSINRQVAGTLETLLETFDVAHLVGQGNLDPALKKNGYVQKAFLNEEFGDVLAAASVVVSRAGANTLYELLALRKPHVLVPLSRRVSRGDQIDNARLFLQKGYSRVMEEDALDDASFVDLVMSTWRDREMIMKRLGEFETRDSVGEILSLVENPGQRT